jgi:hypothetical protein
MVLVVMGREETKQPRPFGQEWEQGPKIARQPPIERTVPDALERMQEPQGDHLPGPEVRLRVFGDGAQLLINDRLPRRVAYFSDGTTRGYRSGPTPWPRWAVCTLLKTCNPLIGRARRPCNGMLLAHLCMRSAGGVRSLVHCMLRAAHLASITCTGRAQAVEPKRVSACIHAARMYNCGGSEHAHLRISLSALRSDI